MVIGDPERKCIPLNCAESWQRSELCRELAKVDPNLAQKNVNNIIFFALRQCFTIASPLQLYKFSVARIKAN